MNVVDVVIIVGWVAFWIYWLAASFGVKAGQTRSTRFVGVRVAVILLVLLLVRTRFQRSHDHEGPVAARHRPGAFPARLGSGYLGQALSRPELGHADDAES